MTATVIQILDGSTLSPETRNFNFGFQNFPLANMPWNTRGDSVGRFGWNVDSNGQAQDPTDACFSMAFEDFFRNGATGNPAFEWFLELTPVGGSPLRPFGGYFPRDGGSGSSMHMAIDVFAMSKYDGSAPKVQWNLSENNVVFAAPFVLNFAANNTQSMKQRNAAGTADISLPYVDLDNRIRFPAPFVSVGPAPTTGSYANVHSVTQATALAGNGVLRLAITPAITGDVFHDLGLHQSTGIAKDSIYNNKNAPGAGVAWEGRVIGPDAGDIFHRFIVNGVGQWEIGLRNKADDSIQWCWGTLGASPRASLTTSGKFTVAGGLGVGNHAAATTPGTICKKVEMFDHLTGASIGFIPVYSEIT